MSEPQDAHMARISVLGRSVLSHLQQVLRNAEVFESNNQIFVRLAKTMSSYIRECFELLGGCTLRIDSYQVFLEDTRVYIDAGMVESVNFLSSFFRSAGIGGLFFHEECLDPNNLLKSIFVFRETVLDSQARGVDAIKRGLEDRHCPFLLPVPWNQSESTMTGIRDETNARKFAFRNAAKLMMFLEDMHRAVENQETIRVAIAYRVLLNLIRVNENYPHVIMALMQARGHDPVISRLFVGVILVLATSKRLRLNRQVQLDLAVASLFHLVGYQSLPKGIRESDKIKEYLPSVPSRGARKILETRFVNRSLFLRLVVAFQVPSASLPNSRVDQMLPLSRLVSTVDFLVRAWKDPLNKKHTLFDVLEGMFQTQAPEIDKGFLLILAITLGKAPPATMVVLDREQAALIVQMEETGKEKLHLETIPKSPTDPVKRLNWELDDENLARAYLDRLAVVPPGVDQPNPMRGFFRAARF